ncbi:MULTISPECIES: baseplate J/gp47 family protein [Bacillus cereus group]|uniref:baseplate J/gp47 family protein n=1 Tax=Bacillus cereus group sp. BfR-BA-01494 TaxID=2920362 RepID=UPI0012988BD4|nr:hypothetical protein [Bacillus thuringiensis]
MLLKRSAQEIIRDACVSISENTPITNFSAGSIARSITEAIAPEIGPGDDPKRVSLYDFAQDVLDQGVISKAVNEHLDLIGGLFSYKRRIHQVRGSDGVLTEKLIDDDMYRAELIQIVPASATANHTSLRLACLTVNGVRDVIGKEYTHGTGSFSFIVIPEYGYEKEEVLHNVEEQILKVKAFGNRPNIITPLEIPIDITVQLAFHESTSAQQKSYISFETQNKLQEYFGKFEMGQGFIYNDLVQEIMNINDKIVDFEILKLYLNNEPVLLTNHKILEDERIIPQNIKAI